MASREGVENPVVPAHSLTDGIFSPLWDMLVWILPGRGGMKSGSSLSYVNVLTAELSWVKAVVDAAFV